MHSCNENRAAPAPTRAWSGLWVAAALGLIAMSAPGAPGEMSPEGHLAGSADMVELLERIDREVRPVDDPFRSRERVEVMRRAAPENPSPRLELQFRFNFAMELLQAGHTEEAIEEVEACRALVEKHRGLADSRFRTRLQVLLA
ncbi:MAG TPA: hypothetical protein VMS21_15810, partial [Methylomirabilota bacterium]|nr:hypothetical protein [Methylomirabilota bacterium]